jgi:hypothetical protein
MMTVILLRFVKFDTGRSPHAGYGRVSSVEKRVTPVRYGAPLHNREPLIFAMTAPCPTGVQLGQANCRPKN